MNWCYTMETPQNGMLFSTISHSRYVLFNLLKRYFMLLADIAYSYFKWSSIRKQSASIAGFLFSCLSFFNKHISCGIFRGCFSLLIAFCDEVFCVQSYCCAVQERLAEILQCYTRLCIFLQGRKLTLLEKTQLER